MLNIKNSYDSDLDNLLDGFWLPCLKNCKRYDRSVGYFSSSILQTWISILPSLSKNLFNQESESKLCIRLVTSPELSKEDIEILRSLSDEDKRSEWCIAKGSNIVTQAIETADSSIPRGVDIFAYLIATGMMEIRFNFPQPGNELAGHHLKEGIFYFDDGEEIAFGGSANESMRGWKNNLEVVDVYRSWESHEFERIQQKKERFERIWNIETEDWKSHPLDPEVIKKLRTRATTFSFNANSTDETVETAEFEPWPHQREAIDIFLKQERGILEMATGTGKTKTTLWIIEELWNSGKIDSVIIAADGNALLDQWAKDLVTFRNKLKTVSGVVSLYKHYGTDHGSERFAVSPSDSILLCSRSNTMVPLRAIAQSSGKKLLLIHDEVHGLGSDGNINSLSGLSENVRYRIGLSATPEREYDDFGKQNEFIENHIGPVIYTYDLEDAIKDGILCGFEYVPLPYFRDEEDKIGIKKVYSQVSARKREGRPMSDAERFIKLAAVYKRSRAKLPIFEEYLAKRPKLLERCILFADTMEYGREVGAIVHDHIDDYKTFFSDEDQSTLDTFAKNNLSCLITCHRLSEGIDIRDLCSVVLFASARGKLETIQRIGRCLRVNPTEPTKCALIIDFIRQPDEDGGSAQADSEREIWLSSLSEVRKKEEVQSHG